MSATICSEIENEPRGYSLAVDIDLHQGHANLKASAMKWPCGGDTRKPGGQDRLRRGPRSWPHLLQVETHGHVHFSLPQYQPEGTGLDR